MMHAVRYRTRHEAARRSTTLAALAAAVMMVLSSPAADARTPTELYLCPQVRVFEVDESGVATTFSEARAGGTVRTQVLLLWEAREVGSIAGGTCVLVEPPAGTVIFDIDAVEVRLGLTVGGSSRPWTALDETVSVAEPPAGPFGETWSVSEDLGTITGSRPVTVFSSLILLPGVAFHGTVLGSSTIEFELPSDLPSGTFTIGADFLFFDGGVPWPAEPAAGEDALTISTETPLAVTGVAVDAPAGPGAVVSCSEPQVGGTVTCGLTSEPMFDFVWEASTNPVFASGVVTTDATGTGRFSFSVPPSAQDELVLVEIVDWTAPTPIGVATPQVPTGLPAGGGTDRTSPVILLLGVGMLAAVLGVRASGTRRRAW